MIQQLSIFASKTRATRTSSLSVNGDSYSAQTGCQGTRPVRAFLSLEDFPSPATTILARIPRPGPEQDGAGLWGLALVDTAPTRENGPETRYISRSPAGLLKLETGDELGGMPASHSLIGKVVGFLPAAAGLRYVHNLYRLGSATARQQITV